MSVIVLLVRLIQIYSYIIIGSALLSWLPVDRNGPLVRFMDRITDPVLAPIRRLIPPEKTGGLDVSPLLALVALQILGRLIMRV